MRFNKNSVRAYFLGPRWSYNVRTLTRVGLHDIVPALLQNDFIYKRRKSAVRDTANKPAQTLYITIFEHTDKPQTNLQRNAVQNSNRPTKITIEKLHKNTRLYLQAFVTQRQQTVHTINVIKVNIYKKIVQVNVRIIHKFITIYGKQFLTRSIVNITVVAHNYCVLSAVPKPLHTYTHKPGSRQVAILAAYVGTTVA